MRLAFTNNGKYTDFEEGYNLYVKRSRTDVGISEETYRRIIRKYCSLLADRLYEEGFVNLPGQLGAIAVSTITRRPLYMGKKFIGYGSYDWKKREYDGKLKTIGLVYLPRRNKLKNLRCYGFVANRRLFHRIKKGYEDCSSPWVPIEFNDDMI